MIRCTFDSLGRMERTMPSFAKAFAFLREQDLANLPLGRYELDENAYVNVVEIECADGNVVLEAHEKYIDLQYLIAGEETYYTARLRDCAVKQAYDADKDYALYTAQNPIVSKIKAGEMMIFFPDDAHAPSHGVQGARIKKAIVKIKA